MKSPHDFRVFKSPCAQTALDFLSRMKEKTDGVLSINFVA